MSQEHYSLLGTTEHNFLFQRSLYRYVEAELWEARHIGTHQIFWVLAFDPWLSQQPERYAALCQELEYLSSVKHPHVFSILDRWESSPHTHRQYMMAMMPLGESIPLRQSMEPLLPREMIDLFSGLATLIDDMARWGILLDLRPDQIFFRSQPFAFGYLLLPKSSTLTVGTQAGWAKTDPHYLSPEEAAGHPQTLASCYFSLGSLLFEVLTGQSAFAAPSVGQTLDMIRSGTSPVIEEAHISHDVRGLLQALMHPEPTMRLQDPYTFQNYLQNILSQPDHFAETRAVMPEEEEASAFSPSQQRYGSVDAGSQELFSAPIPSLVPGVAPVGGMAPFDSRVSSASSPAMPVSPPGMAPPGVGMPIPSAPPRPQGPGGSPAPVPPFHFQPPASYTPPREAEPLQDLLWRESPAKDGGWSDDGADAEPSGTSAQANRGSSSGMVSPTRSARDAGRRSFPKREALGFADNQDASIEIPDFLTRAASKPASPTVFNESTKAAHVDPSRTQSGKSRSFSGSTAPTPAMRPSAPSDWTEDATRATPVSASMPSAGRYAASLEPPRAKGFSFGFGGGKTAKEQPILGEDMPSLGEVPPTVASLREEEKLQHLQKKTATETTVKVLRRKGVVRHYTQMNPGLIFPLLVSLVEAELYIKIPDLPRVQQFESENVLNIKETAPFVRLVPVLPGCIVSPPEVVVDVRQPKVDAVFWVAPISEGDLTLSARVEIWHDGVCKDTLPLPCVIRTQFLTKVASAFSIISAVSGSFLEAFVGKSSAVAASPSAVASESWAASLAREAVKLLSSSGLWIGVFFLLTALACYLWLRPKRGDVMEKFLHSEIH